MSAASQNDVQYQLSRIVENDVPLSMKEIRSIARAAMQEIARLRQIERETLSLLARAEPPSEEEFQRVYDLVRKPEVN